MRVRTIVMACAIAAAAGAVPVSASAPQAQPAGPNAIRAFQNALASGNASDMVEARRAMFTAPRADGGLGFQPLPDARGGARPSEFPWSWGYPAGDLDGDSLDDAFVLHLGNTREMLFTARRGLDGGILWSESLAWPAQGGYWGAIAFMDLAGDDAEEVVLYRERVEGPRSDGFAWSVRAQSVHQWIDVLDARTGSAIYSREETATIEHVFLPAVFTLRVHGLLVSIDRTDDLGGAPSSDLLMGWIEHSSVLAAQINGIPPYLVEENFSVELIDVPNGEILATLEESHDGHVFVLAAGDLDGDGREDLLALSSDATLERGRVRAREIDGNELWTREMSAPVYASFPEFDLPLADADSIDVVVTVLGRFEFSTHALRGEDGTELWTAQGGLWFRSAGDVDGDGGVELMMSGSIAVGAEMTADGPVAVQMVDGATLRPFWQRFGSQDEDTFEFGCLECSMDVTGDGVIDPVLSGRIAEGNVTIRYHVALDGADGSELWETSTTGRMAVTELLDGDVNGDGIDDVLIAREQRNGRSWSVAFQIADGTDLSPIWAVTLPAPGRPLWLHGWAANLAGDADLEVIVTASAERRDELVERVLAIGTGGLRWAA